MKAIFRLSLSVVLGVSLLGSVAAAATQDKKKPEPGSVLFIGNSYTFVNNLPAVVDGMLNYGAKGKSRGAYTVDSYTRGAASLWEFLDSPADAKCREKVEKGGFRWVVLQDQSQTPAEMPQLTMRAGRGWAQIAKKGGVSAILFITWEHAIVSADGKFSPTPRMQDKLTAAYCRLALEIHAQVAPVGEAWRMWHREFPASPLYSNDGSHPNQLGTYLAACVFYAVLTGESPVGLPATVSRNGRTVLRVPAKDAKECQRIARKVVRSFDPETFLQDLEAREAALPLLADIRPMLVPGVSLKDIIQRLGKPATTYKTGSQTFRHFLLRDGVELQIITAPDGIPTHATLFSARSMAEIIKLK